jgi:outer membrane protein insertion porin family
MSVLGRRVLQGTARVLLLALALGGISAPGTSVAGSGEAQPLVIELITFEGNTRTSSSLAGRVAGLHAGEPATPERILDATERLRASGLFREVRVHTRPGSSPGRIQVIFDVKESRPHLRFGLGYEDFSGWYLIPVQLNMDNLTGRGETFRLNTRFGYRVAGLVLSVGSRWPQENTTSWEARLRAEGLDRIYFLDETEIRHRVERSGMDLILSHRLFPSWTLRTAATRERITPDSDAEVYKDNQRGDRHQGDEIAFADLPPVIQKDLERRSQSRIGASLHWDRYRWGGLAASGVRGRVVFEGVFPRSDPFALVQADLRGYLQLVAGTQLAARLRAGTVSSRAPFYERFYLGGLYTVRGYPSQSLSPPQGHLNVATASFELRSGWIGPRDRPRLVGLLFCDLGVGDNTGFPKLQDSSAGIGYGLRLRLPWVEFVGLDVGHPLSKAPVDEAFHVNFSIGWTY